MRAGCLRADRIFERVHRGLNDIALFRIERQMASFPFNPLLLLILPRLFTLRARYSNSDHCHDRSNVIRRASIELGAILK